MFSIIWEVIANSQMEYNKGIFLLFLFVFFVVYFVVKKQKFKEIWILLGSIAFYIWSGWEVLFIVLLTNIIVYFSARKIAKIYEGYDQEKVGLKPKQQGDLFTQYKKKTKKYVVLAFIYIIGMWVLVKVGKLMGLASVTSFTEVVTGKGIIIPLGISYYTLSTVGYLLDVFWRKTIPETNFFRLLSAMIYFPHIVQGPISKYEDLIKQMKNLPEFDYERVCFGIQLMIWGYIKKMIIADRLVLFTSTIFAKPADYTGITIFIAVVTSAIWLYADFSGCMDIVRGVAQIMGIDLAENFRQPFFSKDATEFWTRWHITLGAWTKSYIYLPIAMNPKFMKWTRKLKKENKEWFSSFIKAFLPLISVWVFTGLWHGTGFDYLVWGLYWCFMMTLSKETEFIWKKVNVLLHIDTTKFYHTVWCCIRTFLVFAVGRMWTAGGSLKECLVLWKQMFSQLGLNVIANSEFFKYGMDKEDWLIAAIFVLILFVVDIVHERGVQIRTWIAQRPLWIRWIIYYGAIFAILIFGIYGPGYSAASFAYGAF